MFQQKDLSDNLIFNEKLGKGGFGIVYSGFYIKNNVKRNIAIKCELRKKQNDDNNIEFSKSMLCKEYTIFSRIYEIKNRLTDNVENNRYAKKIFDYIIKNNMLSIPDELSPSYMVHNSIIPKTHKLIKSLDYYLVIMDLCGIDLDTLYNKYFLTESCKYYIAYQLLQIMCCVHSCGIIHRDIKPANFVLNKKLDSNKKNDHIKLMVIDFGLSREYYTYDKQRIIPSKVNNKTNSLIGTIRYISINIHEYKNPTIIDDLISLCYILVNLFTEKDLPWTGHLKTDDKFDRKKHNSTNCSCGYHFNKSKNDTKDRNTVAEMKFHTSHEELCDKYIFLKEWLDYLFSLQDKQMPNYTTLYNILKNNTPEDIQPLQFNCTLKK